MKKIYLFSILFMGAVASSVAQTCPAEPRPPANAIPVSTGIPICVMTWNYTGILTGGDHWYIALVKDDGTFIPQKGTGPGTTHPADNFAKVDQATGSAEFYYDCEAPGFEEPEYVSLVYLSDDINDIVVRCRLDILPAAPTPVKLTSFTGRLQNDNSVVLDWASAIELDSYKYEIERSADGLHFTKVGTIDAAGNSVTTIRYTFNDQLPTAGAYFYRLKQIDYNGDFENSKVVYVNSKKGAGVITKLFPNPTKGEIQLVGATSADLSPNNLSVFSITGQRVKYNVVGANAISLDATAPDGVYLLKVKTAQGFQQFKVVKNQSAGH